MWKQSVAIHHQNLCSLQSSWPDGPLFASVTAFFCPPPSCFCPPMYLFLSYHLPSVIILHKTRKKETALLAGFVDAHSGRVSIVYRQWEIYQRPKIWIGFKKVTVTCSNTFITPRGKGGGHCHICIDNYIGIVIDINCDFVTHLQFLKCVRY